MKTLNDGGEVEIYHDNGHSMKIQSYEILDEGGEMEI
jgi:hypothetical protein